MQGMGNADEACPFEFNFDPATFKVGDTVSYRVTGSLDGFPFVGTLAEVHADYVLISPLQIYATANIQLFPNAQICISKRGWIEDFHAEKFPMHVPRNLRISDETLRYLMFEGQERLRLLEDEDEIMPGLSCFWTGVHHRSSVCYVVETARGRVGISDCLFKFGNLEDGEPLGIQESLEEYHAACKRIKRETQIFIPLYEPDVLKRFPGGLIS